MITENDLNRIDVRTKPRPRLTPRQLQVTHQMSLGLTNKEIADRLDVSEFTAKFHVDAAIRALSGINRAGAVGAALRHGLIQ